jgi:aryl-alcohol dehydrogenase-like predicted oxidoreductase
MGMSQSYGPADEGESIATLHRAIELGCTSFDTAQVYGPLTNEELLGRAFKGRRDQVVIATEFGFRFEGGKQVGAERASRPEHIREAVEGSLTRLNTEGTVSGKRYADWIMATIDRRATAAAMSALVSD